MKRVPNTIKQAMPYKRIVASIAEVGIVEPLVVARRHDDTGTLYAGRRPSAACRADGSRQ
jgi:ParB-like chromosome segregation protein Spo0J